MKLLLLALLLSDDVVTLRVSPGGFQFEPGYLVATVTVERHDDNRLLVMDVDGAMSFHTERQLDGADAARVQQFAYNDVPAGEYTVTALVYSQMRERGRATAKATVLSRQH
jgi:hypothetical protein